MTPAESSPFERLMRLTPVGPGRYQADTDPGWNGTAAPNGGVLAALMVRAVETSFGRAQRPVRTISTHYLDAPAPGPVEVSVQELRGGKRVAVYDARITQGGRLMVQGTIVCSAARAQSSERREPPPEAPASDELEILEMPAMPGRPPVFQKLEMRPAFGALPMSGAEEALAGGWLAIRGDDAELDAARLTAMCDLWWPAIFPTLAVPDGAPTLQLTVYLRETAGGVRAPVLARFRTATMAEGHFEERGELWSADGRLLAESMQLALLLPLTR